MKHLIVESGCMANLIRVVNLNSSVNTLGVVASSNG